MILSLRFWSKLTTKRLEQKRSRFSIQICSKKPEAQKLDCSKKLFQDGTRQETGFVIKSWAWSATTSRRNRRRRRPCCCYRRRRSAQPYEFVLLLTTTMLTTTTTAAAALKTTTAATLLLMFHLFFTIFEPEKQMAGLFNMITSGLNVVKWQKGESNSTRASVYLF